MKRFEDITQSEILNAIKKIEHDIISHRTEYHNYMRDMHNCDPALPSTESEFEDELFEIDCCCNLNLINDYRVLKIALNQKKIANAIQQVEGLF